MTFSDAMDLAMRSYQEGRPVVLKGTDGKIIHGEETWTSIAHSKCRVIELIDVRLWNVSHWPQTLEETRRRWLEKRSKNPSDRETLERS